MFAITPVGPRASHPETYRAFICASYDICQLLLLPVAKGVSETYRFARGGSQDAATLVQHHAPPSIERDPRDLLTPVANTRQHQVRLVPHRPPRRPCHKVRRVVVPLLPRPQLINPPFNTPHPPLLALSAKELQRALEELKRPLLGPLRPRLRRAPLPHDLQRALLPPSSLHPRVRLALPHSRVQLHVVDSERDVRECHELSHLLRRRGELQRPPPSDDADAANAALREGIEDGGGEVGRGEGVDGFEEEAREVEGDVALADQGDGFDLGEVDVARRGGGGEGGEGTAGGEGGVAVVPGDEGAGGEDVGEGRAGEGERAGEGRAVGEEDGVVVGG